MQLKGTRNRSPRDMYLFSLIQDGPRGFDEAQQEVVDNVEEYGVDWEVAEDETLMAHLLENNPQEAVAPNAFSVKPAHLSDVPCEPPNCPLTPEQVEYLNSTLQTRVSLVSRSMDVRRTVWRTALSICTSLTT